MMRTIIGEAKEAVLLGDEGETAKTLTALSYIYFLASIQFQL